MPLSDQKRRLSPDRQRLVNLVHLCYDSQRLKDNHRSINKAEAENDRRRQRFEQTSEIVRTLEACDSRRYNFLFEYEMGMQRE